MIKLKYTLLVVLSVLIAGIFTGCSKDDEEAKPYVGTWKTEVGPNESGDQEQLVFIFTNNTFEVEVHQGADASSLVLQTAVTGDITGSTATTMDAVIKGVAVGNKNYVYKETSPSVFESLLGVGIGEMLMESFTADYAILMNVMTLTIPIKAGDTTAEMPFVLTKV